MKQISIALNVILLGTLIFFGCKTYQTTTLTLPNNNNQIASATDNCPPCTDCSAYPPFVGITASTALKMANNYNELVRQKNFDDTRCVWFSLDEIKSFICTLEKANCRKCDKLNLGIRIYYGRYPWSMRDPNNNDLNDLPLNYKNRHTVFMVGTYKDGSSNIDFDPFHLGNCKPDSLNIFSESKAILIPGANEGAVKNHGDLIPPETNTTGAVFLNQQ